jgi:soluble cytochrome b562
MTFVMPPKKASSGLGAALQPLDVNQETLREARTQKRKATSPTPQEEELDQEIMDLKAIHQQVQRKKKMLRLSELQKKISEAVEEMRHLTQDDQDRQPQRRELRQDNSYDDDEWYHDFHHGNFALDNASPLSAELQATPWPPLYKPP